MAFFSRRACLCLMAASLLWGCLAPTLPLPPPNPMVSAPDADGNVRISGNTTPNAMVLALNKRTDLVDGDLTGSSGDYDFLLPGMAGDELRIWVEVGERRSEIRFIEVPER